MSKVQIPKRFFMWRAAPVVGYVFIVLLAAAGFYRDEQSIDRINALVVENRQERERQVEALCQNEAINRAAVRLLVVDLADQATIAIRSNPNTSPELKAALIKQFETYRDNRLTGLPKTPDCREKNYNEIKREVLHGQPVPPILLEEENR